MFLFFFLFTLKSIKLDSIYACATLSSHVVYQSVYREMVSPPHRVDPYNSFPFEHTIYAYIPGIQIGAKI